MSDTGRQRLTHRASCALTSDEHAAAEAAAAADSRSLSGWLRVVILDELARLERGRGS